MDYVKFNAPKESAEFKLLSVQASLHVTARKKNFDLLKLVAGKGVAFKNIRQHLLNEAQRCGLWQKGKPESYYHLHAWYVSVVNFVVWTKKNFSDYNVSKTKVVETPVGKKEAPREIIVRTEVKKDKPNIVITTPDPSTVKGKTPEEHKALGKTPEAIKTEEQGEIARLKAILAAKEQQEVPDTMKASTPAPLPVGSPVKITETPAPKKGAGEVITRPVEECLTTIQIQTIVFKNLSILGKKAEELGAAFEFNTLMQKMGLVDEMIDLSASAIPESIAAPIAAN